VYVEVHQQAGLIYLIRKKTINSGRDAAAGETPNFFSLVGCGSPLQNHSTRVCLVSLEKCCEWTQWISALSCKNGDLFYWASSLILGSSFFLVLRNILISSNRSNNVSTKKYTCPTLLTLPLHYLAVMFFTPFGTWGGGGSLPENLERRRKKKGEMPHLTLTLLTWRIGWTPNNASKWQMGFNLAFKKLNSSKSVWKYIYIYISEY
jgi:hypothetical protein